MINAGEKLKYYRKVNKYTQDMLAEMVGVDRSTIASYELGRREISYERAKQFAAIFHIKPEEFFERIEEDNKGEYTFYVKHIDKKTYQRLMAVYNVSLQKKKIKK